MIEKKTIEYGGKTLYVLRETLNFYFVSEKEDGSNPYPLEKMAYQAYKKEKKRNDNGK